MTDVRRIVVINGEDFVGLVTTPTILAVLERTLPALGTFANQLRARGEVLADVDGEMGKVFALWNQQLSPAVEQSVTTVITPDIMRRWFGDAMFQTPLRVTESLAGIDRRPAPHSRLSERHRPGGVGRVEAGTAKSAALMAVDKLALNAQLAHTYVMELMDKARIA